uniref:DNA (cytosine-5-)-methyltransferase n=1 Tax=Dimocarpus longan TaxID=128017 RepID=A0A2H5BXZ4_9ROSI|nr:domains rearranged methyltransferase 2 [Dimocarpus longan]
MADNKKKAVVPKPEMLDFEFPDDRMYSSQVGNNVASSSGSKQRSSLLGMGFAPSLVDKVIEEKGEDDIELLIETLFEYTDCQNPDAQSSDSLDSLFGDKDDTSAPEISTVIKLKEEPDAFDAEGHDDDKRATLLIMNFPVNEVDFALEKLGYDAPINELVDFILAAQIAEKFDKEMDNMPPEDEDKKEDANDEILYATMQKTIRLLEMGFSENEISLAIEKFGSKVPVAELADSICAGDLAPVKKEKNSSKPFTTSHSGIGMKNGLRHRPHGAEKIKTEDFRPDAISQPSRINTDEISGGKRPKEEYFDDFPGAASQIQKNNFESNHKGKRPKQEYLEDTSSVLSSAWLEEKVIPHLAEFEGPKARYPNPCRSLDKAIAKPPYFFYGNIANLPGDSWVKISQFLFAIQPEFVNTQHFSALSRREGYVHNLPTSNRFNILPKSAMTIQDAVPQTKKWWPSWDTRKQLSCLSSGTSGITQLCDRLGHTIIESRGLLSLEQQKYILHQCQTSNLVWVGRYKLGPLDPEHLESILGYPMNHTQAAECSLMQRLESLRYCIQTDTMGYHLSVLKSIFPEGLTMLSVFSGIGGAEVTLHRLGIHLKGVISIETSEPNRRILRRWWQESQQRGELVQIEDIQSLTTKKILNLIEKFGNIDFIVCQNPCPTSSRSPATAAQARDLPDFEFSLFYEFVRVLQRVRSTVERKR